MRSFLTRPLLGIAAAVALIGNTPAEVDDLMASGSEAQAFAAAEAGADAGDAELTGYLGWFYDNGRFVPRDAARAAELYRAGAEKGDAFSQWRLAVMIDEGTVVGSLEEAVALFRSAAAQRNSDGMVGLAVMHATGRGTERDFEATMRYYQAAARLGNPHGLQGIGVLYANGEGVTRDMDEAVAYWIVASAAGDATSDELLAKFMPQGEAQIADRVVERADRIARSYNLARFDTTADRGR